MIRQIASCSSVEGVSKLIIFQSPVIYLKSMAMFIINSLIKMLNQGNQNNIWEIIISQTLSNNFNLKTLADQYDINKLELQKITASEMRSKQAELQKRTYNCEDEASKTWLENQYRIFLLFSLAYFKFVNKTFDQIALDDWNLIGKIFKKQPYVCQYFFTCSKKIKSDSWTPEEDKIIEQLMKSQISKKWTSIGLQLFKLTNRLKLKKPKSVRQRWLSHLNPGIKKAQWTVEQQLILVRKIREIGKKWSKIANSVSNRSEHTVKNRFNKLLLKLRKQWPEVQIECTEQQILNLLQNDLKKKLQKYKKQAMENEHTISQSVICSNQEIKGDIEPMTEIQIKGNHIFQPIIITFQGFLML